MNGSPGPGYPPQFIAHFPPVGPGASPIIAIPARSLPAPTESEDASKPSDTELLNRIISSIAKLTHQVKTNGKAIREVAAQQGTIQDRLSLLEQSGMARPHIHARDEAHERTSQLRGSMNAPGRYSNKAQTRTRM